MNPLGPFTSQALVLPPAVPVPLLEVLVSPAASKSFNHVAGLVRSSKGRYQDINAMTWYLRGGWQTKNRHNVLTIRSMHGNEDSGWKDQK